MNTLYVLAFIIVFSYVTWVILKYIIIPYMIEKSIQDIEKNPKWITPKLRQTYYGFSDIDIITAKSNLAPLPRFRIKHENNKAKFEFLIPEDTSVNDIEEVARLALQGKIYIRHKLLFTDKPTHWLAILLYMLDGGDIKQEATSWEKKEKGQETN